jgi:transglutaminase-like putative cysteine protease
MMYLTVRHATTYRYDQPVSLGTHRLMLRPRDSHDLRLVDAELTLSPPGSMRWMHDVFGNSVAQVEFEQSASELMIVSTLHLERYGLSRPVFPIAPEAQMYPFVYSANDRGDLGRLLDRHYPDPRGVVDRWAKRFLIDAPMPTYNLLSNINGAIKTDFKYAERYEEGTQSPLETLKRKSGTCRDFALLFIEAVRSLGFGARFVTGYLYDPDPAARRAVPRSVGRGHPQKPLFDHRRHRRGTVPAPRSHHSGGAGLSRLPPRRPARRASAISGRCFAIAAAGRANSCRPASNPSAGRTAPPPTPRCWRWRWRRPPRSG